MATNSKNQGGADDATSRAETTDIAEVSKHLSALGKQVETLQKQVTEQTKAAEGLSKQLADAEKSHAGKVEELSKQNTSLHKRLSDVEKENAAFKAAAGKPANEPPAKPVTPTDIYTSESGDKYRFLVPVFNYSGNVITAVDALADSEIMEALIEMKSGVLKKLA
jgi:uncharacterized coiled-coil protein SlyX